MFLFIWKGLHESFYEVENSKYCKLNLYTGSSSKLKIYIGLKTSSEGGDSFSERVNWNRVCWFLVRVLMAEQLLFYKEINIGQAFTFALVSCGTCYITFLREK